MQRLVYTPKVYAFSKRSDGEIIDISRYIVSGSVNRRINAVSSATLRIRNPQMIFTTPDQFSQVTFSPMDPITIYLKRLKGRPVRVFTGFLDEAPYLQLYPGVIELRASCTLKRLLYTFFDPALPYTQSFFIAYGWAPSSNGTWFSQDALNDWKTHASDDLKSSGVKDESVDSSISNLLFATMRYIGQWDPNQILIEKLPKDLFTRLAWMSQQFEKDNEEAYEQMKELMKRIIGEGDYEGPEGGGNIDVSQYKGEVPKILYEVGRDMGMSRKAIIAAFMTGINESGMKNLDYGHSSSVGWRQELDTYGSVEERRNVPKSAERFYNEIKAYMAGKNPAAAARRGPYNSSMSAGFLADAVQRPASRSVYGDNPDLRAKAESLLRQIEQKVEKRGGGPEGTGNTTDNSGSGGPEGTGKTTLNDGKDVDKTIRAGGSDKSALGGSVRDKIVELAKKSLTSNSGFSRYSQAGAPNLTTILPSSGRSDCSQWAAAIYYHAGAPFPGSYTGEMLQKGKGTASPKPGDLLCSPDHMEIYVGNGKTIGHGSAPIDYDTVEAVKARHPGMKFLTYPGLGDDFTGTDSGVGGGGGGEGNPAQAGAAGAFFATLNLPSAFEAIEAMQLGGEKSLMNDKPLMPFIQQLCEASLRQFQSTPDGKFFAFYPDYFGEMNHRPPYWEIDDIEVLDGGISVTDDSLVTHMYVVGDTMNPMGAAIDIPDVMRSVFTSGVVTIFNAFMSDEMIEREHTEATKKAKTAAGKKAKEGEKGTQPLPDADDARGLDIILDRADAVAFLQRYGARPHVEDMPMIKHAWFEMFLAYQRFMLAWSKQFESPFEFTFMPELFPGGKLGFPDHGLQMYIEEVTHNFDYISGFTSQAILSAPSIYGENRRSLPPNMVKAIIEPCMTDVSRKTDKSKNAKRQKLDPKDRMRTRYGGP